MSCYGRICGILCTTEEAVWKTMMYERGVKMWVDLKSLGRAGDKIQLIRITDLVEATKVLELTGAVQCFANDILLQGFRITPLLARDYIGVSERVVFVSHS